MPRPETTKVINLDDKQFKVEDLSPQLRGLIEVFDELRVKAYDISIEKFAIDAALNHTQQQLVSLLQEVQKEQKSADAGSNETGPTAE